MRVLFAVRMDNVATGNQIMEVAGELDSVTGVVADLVAITDAGKFYRIHGSNHIGRWIVVADETIDILLGRSYHTLKIVSWDAETGSFEVPPDEPYAESLRVVRDQMQEALNARTAADRQVAYARVREANSLPRY